MILLVESKVPLIFECSQEFETDTIIISNNISSYDQNTMQMTHSWNKIQVQEVQLVYVNK